MNTLAHILAKRSFQFKLCLFYELQTVDMFYRSPNQLSQGSHISLIMYVYA